MKRNEEPLFASSLSRFGFDPQSIVQNRTGGMTGPPAVTQGYQGGALARKITSHDIAPIESLVAQRGRDQPLQEEDEGLRHRRIDTEEETQVGTPSKVEASDPDRPKEEFVFNEDGGGAAPEWTFPDGGWRAWSVVLVSSLR